MKGKAVQVIGVGSPVIDFVAEVQEETISRIHGVKGGMELVDAHQLQNLLVLAGEERVGTPGGSAGNTVFALARLGMDCAFMGKLGDDRNGHHYRAMFGEIGGDCSRFKTDGRQPTACCVSLVTPDSERTLRTCLGAAQSLSPADIEPSDFEGCRHVHLEGYLLFDRRLVESVLLAAKAAGCTISMDLGSFEVVAACRDFLPEILFTDVDIVFANKDEAAAFTGLQDPQGSLNALGRFCSVAAVKIGRDGAWLKNGSQTVKVPAVPAGRLRDTTGAGDYWAAGFLYGHINGYSLATSGAVASLLGKNVVEHCGAVLPQRTWDRIVSDTASLLNENGKESELC